MHCDWLNTPSTHPLPYLETNSVSTAWRRQWQQYYSGSYFLNPAKWLALSQIKLISDSWLCLDTRTHDCWLTWLAVNRAGFDRVKRLLFYTTIREIWTKVCSGLFIKTLKESCPLVIDGHLTKPLNLYSDPLFFFFMQQPIRIHQLEKNMCSENVSNDIVPLHRYRCSVSYLVMYENVLTILSFRCEWVFSNGLLLVMWFLKS